MQAGHSVFFGDYFLREILHTLDKLHYGRSDVLSDYFGQINTEVNSLIYSSDMLTVRPRLQTWAIYGSFVLSAAPIVAIATPIARVSFSLHFDDMVIHATRHVLSLHGSNSIGKGRCSK